MQMLMLRSLFKANNLFKFKKMFIKNNHLYIQGGKYEI
jgi:hypothetical protein